MQQSSLQQPNKSELSIKFPKSEYCSPNNLKVKIRPPLKMRKPDIYKSNQTTIPVYLEEQKPTISQLSSNYTQCQNIPETNSKPLNDSKVHAGYSLGVTGSTVNSGTKGTLHIDNAKHSAIHQPHQNYPTGRDIAKDKQNKATHNQNSTDENDKH